MENKEFKEEVKKKETDISIETNTSEENIKSQIKDNNEKIKNNVGPNVNVQNNTVSNQINKEKPKKEIPIEKKPFQEFVNLHLIPTLKEEFMQRGLQVDGINLNNTARPIAGDKCWVISCEIKSVCNFWLSFEKEDISSLKSISLSKPNQKPSIIESFLIDEKRITLKLITSRIIQRLNGQKLIGVN